MRTPLASIRALAEVAASEPDAALLRNYVRRILANAVDATRIVNQLLAEAAIAHHIETSANPHCDFLELYLQAVERLPTDNMQRCRLTDLSTTHEDFLVCGAPLAFRELIDNLLDNALKYAPRQRTSISICVLRPMDRRSNSTSPTVAPAFRIRKSRWCSSASSAARPARRSPEPASV